MMHVTTLRLVPLLAAMALLCAQPASAQSLPEPWADPLDCPARVDVGFSFGVDAPTDWSDLVVLGSISSLFGVFEQVLVRDLRVEPDRQFSGAVTYWRGRYGFRGQAGLTQARLVLGSAPVDTFQEVAPARASGSVGLDTWSYDVRGVVGLIEYSPSRWVWPYASFGFGGITYLLDHPIAPPLLTFIDRSRAVPLTVEELRLVDQSSREFLLAVDELSDSTVFAFNLAIGTELRLPLGSGGLGVRLEASDHMAPSPVGLRVGDLRRSSLLESDTGVTFGLVHQLRVTAGLVVYIGR